MKTTYVVVARVRYFAVYPDGRELEVSVGDAHQFGEKWEAEEGVQMRTRITRHAYPIIGIANVEKASPLLFIQNP